MNNRRKFASLISFIIINCSIQAQSENDVLKAPMVIKDPATKFIYSEQSRKFSGIPSIAITPKGRMWAVWYAGMTPKEDENNYVVLATSADNGKTWNEILAIDPDRKGALRTFDPQLWIDPDNRLWLFWCQGIGTSKGLWSMNAVDPEKDTTEWTKPVHLTDGVMMGKPLALSNGDWLLPVSKWGADNSAQVVASVDHGKNWALRGAANIALKEERKFDEHMVVERKDGSLWMLVRTVYGIGESISKDRGKTWSDVKPTSIRHPSSRFFIRRLNSGNLLLVKHGPIALRTERSHLMAFISKDDGKSWSKGLLLDDRNAVSYPDGEQTADGTVYIIYDFNRTKEQEIILTRFTEEDVLSDKYDEKIVEVQKRHQIVSKGGFN